MFGKIRANLHELIALELEMGDISRSDPGLLVPIAAGENAGCPGRVTAGAIA